MALVTIPEDVLLRAQTAFSHYQCGFMHLDMPRVGGSGTLVCAGRKKAILTAAHVLATLPKRGEIGIGFPYFMKDRLFHRFAINIDHCTMWSDGSNNAGPDGPDIGLLVLNEVDATRIESRKSFLNLDIAKEQILKAHYSLDKGVWYIAGLVDEKTKDNLTLVPGALIKDFSSLHNPGEVVGTATRDGYDYLAFEVRKERNENIPKSFKGTSGGSLWQVIVGRKKNGPIEFVRNILRGVAFHESLPRNDTRTISCHGPKTIYEVIWQRLATL